MAKRLIIVANGGSHKKYKDSEFTTWKELKAQLKKDGINLTNTEAVERGTQRTFSLPSAILPTSNPTTLLLVPVEQKGGGGKRDDAITDLGKRDLNKVAKYYNIITKGLLPRDVRRKIRAAETKAGEKLTANKVASIVAKEASISKSKPEPVAQISDGTVEGGSTAKAAKEMIKKAFSEMSENVLSIIDNIEEAPQAVPSELACIFDNLGDEINALAKELKASH